MWRRVCGSVSFPALLRDVGDTPHTAHKPFGLVFTGGIQPKFLGPLRFSTPHWVLHRNDIGCVSALYSCYSLSLGHGLCSLRVQRWSPRAARVRRKLRVVMPWLSVSALTRPQTPKFVCCLYGHSGRVSSLLERPAAVRTASRLCEIFVDRLDSSWNPNHEISRGGRRGGARGLQIGELVPTFHAHNRLFNNGIARGRGKRAAVCNVGGHIKCIARQTTRTTLSSLDVAQ